MVNLLGLVLVLIIIQLINEYIAPLQDPYSEASRPWPSGKKQSSEAGEIENRHSLGALDLREAHYRLLDQPQKQNGSALLQSRRMGLTGRREQRTAV